MNSAKRGKRPDEKGPPSTLRSSGGYQRPLKVAGSSHSGGIKGDLNAQTTVAGRNISHQTTTDSQKNPVTSTTNINLSLGYPPQAAALTSYDGSSDTTIIQGSSERRLSGLARVSSEESGITEDLNYLEEIEHLKNQIKRLKCSRECSDLEKAENERLKSRLNAERTENERLKNEVEQLKHLLKDEKSKALEKDSQLERLQNLVNDYECQDERASEFQAAAARTRQNYAKEMHIRDDKIKELEKRCQALEEDNEKYLYIAEKLRAESKGVRDQIRYSQLKKRITELENNIGDLKTRRGKVGRQLVKAEDDMDSLRSASGSSKSKTKTKESVAKIDRLDEEMNVIREALRKAEPQLAALCAEFEAMANPAEFVGELDPDSSQGSYNSHYEPIPDLTEDLSSRNSGSPPQSDTLDTMDTFIMDRMQSEADADPWAKTVVPSPSKGLFQRGSDPLAKPLTSGRGKKVNRS